VYHGADRPPPDDRAGLRHPLLASTSGRVIAQGSYAELTASSAAFQTMVGLQ
jgi:hypothetical protein